MAILTNDEKHRLIQMIGEEYEIAQDEYGFGAHSMAVHIRKLNTSDKYICKMPLKDDVNWIPFQLHKHEICNEAFEKPSETAGIVCESIISYNENFYITHDLGKPFFLEMNQFSHKQIENILDRLAVFLSELHAANTTEKGSEQFRDIFLKQYDEGINWMISETSYEFVEVIDRIRKKIQTLDVGRYHETFVHGDVNGRNILIQSSKLQVGLIDYDCSGYSSILSEFVPYATSGYNLPMWVFKEIINKYNKYSKEEVPLSLLRDLWMASIVREYGMCAKLRRVSPSKASSIILLELKKFDKESGIWLT